MDFNEDQRAAAIAEEWGVAADLLNEAQWAMEGINNHDGFPVSYFVRFSDDTERDLLNRLGVAPGEFSREISVNAVFSSDEPDDEDDGIYSINEPFPDISEFIDDDEEWEDEFSDLPPGQAYLTDENDRIITDEHGRGLIVDAPASSSTIGGAALNENAINDPIYERRNFVRHSYSTHSGRRSLIGNDNHSTSSSMPTFDQNAIYQQELETRIELLEAALETYRAHLPPRNHNHPPELVEPDPIAASDFDLIVKAVAELKIDARAETPDPAKLEAKASLLRRVAGVIAAWCGRKADAAVDAAIQWAVPAVIVWGLANPQKVQAALNAVADTALEWAQYLQSLLP